MEWKEKENKEKSKKNQISAKSLNLPVLSKLR